MSVITLSKVQIFGIKKNQDILLEELQKLGIAEIRKIEQNSYYKTKIRSEEYLEKLTQLLELLENEAKLGFQDKNRIQYVSSEDFFHTQKNTLENNYALIDKIFQNHENCLENEIKLKEIEQQIEILNSLKDVNISPIELKPTTYLTSILGKISNNTISLLKKSSEYLLFDFDILSTTKEYTYILLFCHKDYDKAILNELKLLDFQEWSGPVPTTGTFSNLFTSLVGQELSIKNNINTLKMEFHSYLKELEKLQKFYDYLSNKVSKDLIQFYIQEDAFLFRVEAYIPNEKILILEKTLEKISACDYDILELEENEEYPSLIENNRFARPFEFVTDMYSRPGKEDIDPTPFFAPFFAVFMGMAIGDAGVGLVLALICRYIIKKTRANESTKKLLGVAFYGGLMAIVVGILTGTYFAIPFEHFGVHIPYLYKPEKDIMIALGVSFAAGFIHITFGYFIRFMHLLTKGDIFGAIFDGVTHIFIMLCGLMFVLGTTIPSLAYLKSIATTIFIVDVILILFTSGRHYSDSFIGRILWGFYGVYELTAIVGDLLSYARLFALGLAGGIIASAINELSPAIINGISFGSVGSSIHAVIMIIIFVAILLIGHIFAAFLAILGAFIHTMRLQFVEFFGKFFYGGGEAFNPLNIKSKYFWIKQDIDRP